MAAQRIAVIGSGAIGGVLAAAARAAGHEVVVCARTPFDRLVVETPDGTEEPDVTVVTDPAELGPVDWALLTTKVQDTASAAGWLRAVDPAPVAVVQNGIEHRATLAPFELRSPVLPALIYISAERTSPGHVVRRSPTSMQVPDGELGERFRELLRGPQVHATDDFRTAAWRKLLTNVSANPISALTMRRMSVFDVDGVRELAREVLQEAVAVGRAEGAALGDEEVDKTIDVFVGLGPDSGTSMLYDRLAGLGTEHEHLTGALVRAARRHGIPVPRNETLLVLLRALPENSG